MNDQWLPLTEYSSKYKVSVSTLRRRIRSSDIQFKFDDGKYFLADEPFTSPSKNNRPSQALDLEEETNSMPTKKKQPKKTFNNHSADQTDVRSAEPSSELIQAMLAEIKKAYSAVLHEKEEQILILKEEISDLKTLVKILESDNERLRHIGSVI